MNINLLESDSEEEMPPAWEERATSGGDVYYINHVTKNTQWVHPRTGRRKMVPKRLPYGWKKVVNPDGKVVFYDTVRNAQSLTDPRLALTIDDNERPEDVRYTYDSFTTALEVLHGQNLSDNVAIVTGANSGVGYETARSLALHGCCVIFACRSLEKGQQAVDRVKSERPSVNCIPMLLDLSSLNSVRRFAAQFIRNHKQLNFLILNAGVFWLPYTLTEDKYEATFQICHLSHFCLTNLLERIILSSIPARVIVVSCESHRYANLIKGRLVDTMLYSKENEYSRIYAYNNAKLCNMLFIGELHERWFEKGVQVFAVHPGNMILSGISRHCNWIIRMLYIICRPFCKSLQQAASTTVFCATSQALNGLSGVYFNNCVPCPPSKESKDRELAKELWFLSEDMVKYALKVDVSTKLSHTINDGPYINL